MAKEKIQPSDSGSIKPGPGTRPADQAEGERDGEQSRKVKRTPDQAEGEREDASGEIRKQQKP